MSCIMLHYSVSAARTNREHRHVLATLHRLAGLPMTYYIMIWFNVVCIILHYSMSYVYPIICIWYVILILWIGCSCVIRSREACAFNGREWGGERERERSPVESLKKDKITLATYDAVKQCILQRVWQPLEIRRKRSRTSKAQEAPGPLQALEERKWTRHKRQIAKKRKQKDPFGFPSGIICQNWNDAE